MEFLVDGAERIYTEDGKLQHLSYWSYKLLTRSFLESYQNPQLFQLGTHRDNFSKGVNYVDFCTWHRYSDFEWLAAHIALEFPGIIFPPIPSKETEGTKDKLADLFSSGKEDNSNSRDNPFVQKRMRQLQLTLNVISQLHEIHESPVLKAFTTLDESSWHAFREDLRKKEKKSVFSVVKSKGANWFSKLRSLGDMGERRHYVSSSPLNLIFAQQSDLARLLHTCFLCIEQVTKESTTDLRYWSDMGALSKPTQGSPLPWTACYCGHLVRHSKHRELEGVVRDIDDEFASVEWNGQGGELAAVRLEELEYPSSGVSDPTILVLQEFTAQIESYCVYLSRSPEVTKLKNIEDTLWFLSMYATQCVNEVERLREAESQIQSLTKATEKKTNCEHLERIERLKQELSFRSSRFIYQFNNFYRSYVQKSLIKVAQEFGEVMDAIGTKGEWDNRLSQVFAMLSLCFDFQPQEKKENGTDDVCKDDCSSGTYFSHVVA